MAIKIPDSQLVHASCVAIKSKGVIFFGKSGSGKSDLSLRMIARGAQLVSDDQVQLKKKGKNVVASAPKNIKGLLEIRGLGINKLPHKADVDIKLIVELTDRESVERMPEQKLCNCLGIKIPLIKLHAFDVSTPIKVELAIK